MVKNIYAKKILMPSSATALSAARTLPFILLGLAMLALAGCDGGVMLGAGTAGMIYLTKPSDPPPADTEHSIQPHESWCYETMGDPVCYAHAQDVNPDRLINVDPPNRYPLTPRAYDNEIHPPPPPPAPQVLAPPDPLPIAPVPVSPAPLDAAPVVK